MPNREERLRIVASGKCSAASRAFGPRVKYLSAVNGIIIQLSEEEDDCFDSSKEAVAAAKLLPRPGAKRSFMTNLESRDDACDVQTPDLDEY